MLDEFGARALVAFGPIGRARINAMVAQNPSTAAAEAIDHRSRSGNRKVRQLGIRPVEMLVIKKNTQTPQNVLFAAAVQFSEMSRRQKPMARDMDKDVQIA